jgi:hypothetical protein
MATNQDPRVARTTSFEVHPLYRERLEDWVLMEDTYAGERRMKDRGTVYLKPTAGQRQDGMTNATDQGYIDYIAYKERAIFHDVVKEAVQSMIGVMHRKDATITVPDKMKPMIERITPDGESATSLLRKINEQQLLNARVGLLVEVPSGVTVDKAMPFIATYAARSIVNWDTGISEQGERKIELVALDESAWERENTFNWKFVEKTRLLVSDPSQLNASMEGAGKGYQAAVLRDGKHEPGVEDFKAPSIGGRTMDVVPFVFCNANDLVPDPEAPPLLGLANIAVALYRADADYRQNLFMQGQDTLVIIGSDNDEGKTRTGAGAIIDVPKGGDAKYIGVSAAGLDAQEKAIDKLLMMANERGTKLLDFDAASNSSGEALKVRVAARTTTLLSITKTGSEALQAALRFAATWLGLNPEEVTVEPNVEFADQVLTGQDLQAFAAAKNSGLPLSWQSIHALLVQNDMTHMSFEEEMDVIEDEAPVLGAPNVPVLGPDGEPMLHPETGQPLTEPAKKRGAPGKKPVDDEDTGKPGSAKAGKGGKKVAQANNSGQGGQQ